MSSFDGPPNGSGSTTLAESSPAQARRARASAWQPRSPAMDAVDLGLTRALDLTVCICALVFLMPFLVVIALLVFVSDPGPVFFAHRRIGKDGRPFPCFKFRSMVTDAEQRLHQLLASDPIARAEWNKDHKLKSDPRITKVGDFLRRSSIDELPQLFNVLRGDMSIVGPRPIVKEEVVRYGRYFADYCRTKPGITGLWQISGRNDVSYRRRVALDTTYSRTRSFGFDLRIMFLTIPAVLAARGSY